MNSVNQQISENLQLMWMDSVPKFLWDVQRDMSYKLMLWHTIKYKLLGDKNV
jgi:hypothetical protein